jgi:intraflagellar transport protein 172
LSNLSDGTDSKCVQWKKATAIVDSLKSTQTAKRYFVPLATHFAEVADYSTAEKYFVMAEKHQAAVQMYTNAQLWEQAHTLALSFMSEQEVAVLYISQAKDLEAKGQLRDAERLYLAINEPDLAITMFKNHKQYDQMIRLVAAHHKDLLVDTHLYLAKTLESEGNFKQAEQHFVEGDDFKSAINMYCVNSLFEEAYKVC